MAMRPKKDIDEAHVIDVDAAMQGTLIFKDPVNLRIKGKFEGTLEIRGNLEISETALVEAHIKGENIVIRGRVKGDIEAERRIELLDRAVVEGNIKTPRLAVEDGAVFQGKCIMLEEIMGTEELAKHLDVDLNTVLSWVNSGRIPGFKQDEEWRFDRKRIDDWIASGKLS